MKHLKLPTAHTIIFLLAGLVCLLTWIIPAGQYAKLSYSSDEKNFEIQEKAGSLVVSGSQKTLDSLNIKIPIEKFESGSIWKPVGIPGTFTELESNPQSFIDFLQSPIKGIMGAMDVILFVLIIGGFIGVVEETGAFYIGIQWLSKALKGKEAWLVIIVTTLIALGGTTFGLAEETIAFFPILIPVFVAAGYDPLVAVATLFLGSSLGTTASTVNPFSTIIASDAAGITWTDGLTMRLIYLILGLAITIYYIIRYGNKVKSGSKKSMVNYDYKMEWQTTESDSKQKLGIGIILTYIIFVSSFVLMILGVSQWEWWFLEMTTIFFVSSILVAFAARIPEKKYVNVFVKGSNALLSVALIIGIARGVTVLMESGQISDSILNFMANSVEGMSGGVFVNALMLVFGVLSFFVPSSSGLAVLTMPIMAPLADVVGVDRAQVVDSYQFGSGLFHFINPTGLLLPSLAIAKIGFNQWFKFVLPLLGILTLLATLCLCISVYVL